jgi:hypothetical protein
MPNESANIKRVISLGNAVTPSHLIGCGQQALAAITIYVATGVPLVQSQFLASEFEARIARDI